MYYNVVSTSMYDRKAPRNPQATEFHLRFAKLAARPPCVSSVSHTGRFCVLVQDRQTQPKSQAIVYASFGRPDYVDAHPDGASPGVARSREYRVTTGRPCRVWRIRTIMSRALTRGFHYRSVRVEVFGTDGCVPGSFLQAERGEISCSI